MAELLHSLIDDRDHYFRIGDNLRRAQRATSTSLIVAGTSINGPIKAAKAAPLSIPKVATAAAIANSKQLDAAVKESVAHCG
jgi:hypothetical protein